MATFSELNLTFANLSDIVNSISALPSVDSNNAADQLEHLQKAIIGATMGVVVAYAATWILRIFGGNMPFIHDAGPIGILFSLVVVGIAAFNLLIDFDYIDRLNQTQHDKWQDWFAAMGLLITVVWIYLELLRLLSKIRR